MTDTKSFRADLLFLQCMMYMLIILFLKTCLLFCQIFSNVQTD